MCDVDENVEDVMREHDGVREGILKCKLGLHARNCLSDCFAGVDVLGSQVDDTIPLWMYNCVRHRSLHVGVEGKPQEFRTHCWNSIKALPLPTSARQT